MKHGLGSQFFDTLILSLPSRGAWIETARSPLPAKRAWSLPSRGAWIETVCVRDDVHRRTVAPLTGGVD